MKVAIIGSGFSGLSAAAYLSKAGHDVHVFEKNDRLGGRARQFTTPDGYVFDMGPSWYWMPDVFENFFRDFGTDISQQYDLQKLNPQFEMVFDDEVLAVPADYGELRNLFEKLEPGSAERLDKFMDEAKYKYEVGMGEFVSKPCLSWFEFASLKIARSAVKLDLLTNFKKHVRQFFSHPKLIALMEFPVLFLGAMPQDIPALYSLMNYGGLKMGTWYPMGGFVKIIDSMVNICRLMGVQFHSSSPVTQIKVEGRTATGLVANGVTHHFDAIISSADYHHTEQSILEEQYRNYDEDYWSKKTFAPSSLIYYLGIKETIPNLDHHTLFFENDLDIHANEIYKDKKWPTKPLFYACCPSKTDKTLAPEGHENIFLLMPIATGLEDGEDMRQKYFEEMIFRIERHTGVKDLKSKIAYQRSYCVQDFISDYNAYQGNAYGLANTLMQTAVLKPSIKNKHIDNLYYTGQLTVPGPGVPPSLISGKIVANEVHKLKIKSHAELV
jgi:phytoene desaturase